MQSSKPNRIQVAVRLRPLNEKEKNEGARKSVEVFQSANVIQLRSDKKCDKYKFDAVYGCESTQVGLNIIK